MELNNVSICDKVLDTKLDTYGIDKNNFVAATEITVEITLNEYRSLVASDATASQRIQEANDDKYKRDSENGALRKQLDELKAENYELKKKLELYTKEDTTNE